ncbi:MORN repeat-containing protein 1 isoform X2 [Lepisosteus oculatus]|uniref:MORN repeat-containing protein 1 isoform X2 n=1 Tax=Lepisosteus oculatus TaxID=7918 RepID=UPI00074034F2|nr:PREDICTED: MORN repeat-containing protein 1 isoform X2 [Lepisosteus oculatus]
MAASQKQQRNSQYYVGEVKSLLRDGYGLYVYPNSFFRYEGQWKLGKKHGHGKLVMKDGSYYEGEFVNGEIEGNGLRYWACSGNTYSGQFNSGELHGYGVMQYGTGERFEGEFSFGLREGHGFLVDKEGQIYEGSFHKNKKHGEGQMTYRNGDQYEGDWILDQRQGHGVMHFADGSIYEGQWRNNLFNGQGTMIHCSGVIYEGLWTSGQPAGGASKIVIEGGDMLEVFQRSPFTLEVQLQNEEEEIITGENGRVLQIWAGVRKEEVPPTSSCTTLLKLIEDIEEKPVLTPFGFECISYPLMERVFESDDSRGSAPLAVAKSGFVQTDSPIPEGESQSGSGSDTVALGGGTPSYLDGKTDVSDQIGESEATAITESISGLRRFSELEEDWHPPPANQRVEAGRAKFQNLMLAPPPPNYQPFLLVDETEKQKGAKKPAGKGPSEKAEKLTSSQEKNADSRSSVGSRLGVSPKKDAADNRTVRPGEYVIMVKEVTSPPFLDSTLPSAFVLLRVVPPKSKTKTTKKETLRVKSK